MKSLLLLGSGGHAKVVAETALATGLYSRIAFLDDGFSATSPIRGHLGFPVLGPCALAFDACQKKRYSCALVAIGDSRIRLSLLRRLTESGYEVPTLCHPTAFLSPSSRIDMGTVIFSHAVVQANANVGFGCILNTCSSVDHDSIIGDGVHICPGAHLAGEVLIGDHSWIGIGSSIIQKISIGSNVTVGAGAAGVHDLPGDVTAVGVPARILSPKT